MTQSEALIEALSDYQPHILPELRETVIRLRGKPCTDSALSARWRELHKHGVETLKPYTLPGAPNTFYYKMKRPLSADNAGMMLLRS
jgi:hypothetical protein